MASPLDPYRQDILTASKKYKVPAALLAAQISRESGFNPNAKSPAGALGISQFMPGTAAGFHINPLDPHQSIDAQGKMMRNLLKMYKGDVSLALAGYNAGSGNVAKAGGKVPNIPETQAYVKNILADMKTKFPGLAATDTKGFSGGGDGSAGGTLPLPDGTPSTVPGKPRETAAQTLSAPAQPVGPTAGGFMQAALQTLGTNRQSSLGKVEARAPQQMLPLPGGATSTVPVNKVVVSKAAQKDAAPIPTDGLKIVSIAEKFKGTPYKWGGSTPKTGFDCSGLLQYSVAQATGKVIPRVASAQYAAATKVKPNQMKPGDGVWFGTPDNIHHVGIYIGNGKYIQAPKTGDVVKISNLSDRSDIVGAGRFTD